MKFLGIIPARYASTRFPAKPLAILGGKTVIQRVYEQVAGVLDDAYVATDDERIEAVVKAFGGKVVMTSVDHKSGTDRCYEACMKSGGDFDVVVNIQGDEPFIQPSQLDAVKACFERLIEKNERAASGLKISSMEADGQKLTIHTSEKNPILINWLTDPFACVIDVSEEVNGNNHVIGTGPYTLESATTDKVVVKANKSYWNGTPKFGTINVQCFLDGDTMAMALQNGELDACANLGYANLPIFENNSNFEINSAATSRSYMFVFNTQSEEFSDVNVRKAVTMAINKEGFVNTLMNGFGEVAQLCYPASYEFGDSKVKGPEYKQEASSLSQLKR